MTDFEYTDARSFNSSAIDEAYWDSVTSTLLVVFKHGGVAGYRNFLRRDWLDFISAESTNNIKGKFHHIDLPEHVRPVARVYSDTAKSIPDSEEIKDFKWTYNKVFPESTVFYEGFYDGLTRTLLLSFAGGRYTAYAHVPFSIWKGLLGADSKGAYFSKNVRGKFSTIPLANDFSITARSWGAEDNTAPAAPQTTFVVKAQIDGTISFSVSGKDIHTPDDAIREFNKYMEENPAFEGTLKIKELTQRFE